MNYDPTLLGNVIHYELSELDVNKSRLDGFAQDYDQVAFNVSVEKATSVENLAEMLDTMAQANIHFVGSRGYAYNSKMMAHYVRAMGKLIEDGCFVSGYDFACLTRTGGLRETFIRLIEEE